MTQLVMFPKDDFEKPQHLGASSDARRYGMYLDATGIANRYP